MALLNYDVLKKSGYDGYILEKAPVKVLQFGEGNFLRAFVDYWFDMSNEKAGWNAAHRPGPHEVRERPGGSLYPVPPRL